jgi:predicted ATPase
VVIRTPDRRLRVFVSSTVGEHGELAQERMAVERAIAALRLTPVMFDLGARPHPPQQLYRAYLAQSDVFVGLYWQRYGRVTAGMDVSGLEEEFDLAAGLPRLLYVKTPAPEREPGLARLLDRVKGGASESYRYFRTPAELGRLVRDDLATLLSERFAAARAPAAAPGSVPAGSPTRRRRGPRPLPVGTTSLVGRAQAIEEVAGLLDGPGVRLVTLTGPGGVGKTRLAMAVGQRLGAHFDAGTVFVPLAWVTQPEQVVAGIGRAVGADLARTDSPLQALAERLGEDRWLLVLDNLEQVLDAAADLDELLARCPGVAVLATSRTALGLRAEHEYPVPPLPLPADPDPAGVPLAELAASPAVALFVDRARAVRPGFALTPADAPAVAELCRRLEGLPLAIELAAARTRLLDPAALLERLAGSLDALGQGAVDLPERQRTLRATVAWSVGLLDEAERSLLEAVAVFVDGWTVEAAAEVAGIDTDRALALSEALARHSLVQLDRGGPGPRLRMLETVRAFVAERLAARPDAAEIRRRHADHYRALAERADRPLRGVGWSEWAERLHVEEGNLAAAIGWYLDHDREPLPHLFRVLLPLWALQDDLLVDARSWVEVLLPTADTLDPQARAELLWAAAVTAREAGDDAAALAARERLRPLLAGIQDPYLRAVCQLATAWASAIVGDFDGALREARTSLEALRGQDEPLWTAAALVTLGSLETALGRHDDALAHLGETRDLAERFDNPVLTAASQVQLGILAVARGRPEEASALLDEALELNMVAHSARNVSLCLAAFAQLAFQDGDPEQAARLLGAAEGLRRRAGLRAWPTPFGADPAAQIRQASGRTGSTRCSPPAPSSTSGRPWPPSTIGVAQAAPAAPLADATTAGSRGRCAHLPRRGGQLALAALLHGHADDRGSHRQREAAHHRQFQPGEDEREPVQQRRAAVKPELSFAAGCQAPLQPHGDDQPAEHVGHVEGPEPGRGQVPAQQRPGVAADVPEHLVGTAPQPAVRGHGDHQVPARPQHAPRLLQGPVLMLQVLDHVQQRHDRGRPPAKGQPLPDADGGQYRVPLGGAAGK